MAAVTMHHFSGLAAPFVRSKGTVSGGVFSGLLYTISDLCTTDEKWLETAIFYCAPEFSNSQLTTESLMPEETTIPGLIEQRNP